MVLKISKVRRESMNKEFEEALKELSPFERELAILIYRMTVALEQIASAMVDDGIVLWQTMTPFADKKCAVCDGVVYEQAHYTAVEGDLVVYVGSNECVIALARCMKETGLSLEEAVNNYEN